MFEHVVSFYFYALSEIFTVSVETDGKWNFSLSCKK